MEKFQEKLKRIRTEKGLSYKELAKLSGVTATEISALELGERNPSPKTIRKLSDALDCDYSELYDSANSN